MRTIAQTAIRYIGTSVVVSAAVLAGVVSLLTSAAGLPEVEA